jgi:hypothetical protein
MAKKPYRGCSSAKEDANSLRDRAMQTEKRCAEGKLKCSSVVEDEIWEAFRLANNARTMATGGACAEASKLVVRARHHYKLAHHTIARARRKP